MDIDVEFIRTLRTATSERFIVQARGGNDAAACDLHFLENGSVAGTVTIFEDGVFDNNQTERLLNLIDSHLLPSVSVEEGNLSFTVVVGRVVGNFTPESQA